MSPKVVDRKARRAEIAGIALDVFARHGLDVPMEEIARAANLGKGTLYQYFRSKTELIADSVLVFFQRIDELTQDASRQMHNPEERLRFEVKRIVRTLFADDRYARITVGILRLAQTEEGLLMGRTLNRDVNRRFVRLTANRILEGISQGVFRPETAKDAEKMAMNIIALVDGLWFNHYLGMGDLSPEEQLDFYLDTLFEHLRKTPSAPGEDAQRRSTTTGNRDQEPA